MQEIRAKFVESVVRTKDVTSFRFVPENKIDFTPGQFAQVIFDEQNRQNKDLNKYLSFSCDTGKSYFEVTKKLSASAFSDRLRKLLEADSVLFKLPLGNCVLGKDTSKVLFIAGGIGITPVISILEHTVNTQQSIDIKLIYSNWTEADIAFRKELDDWSKAAKNIEIIHTLVNEKPVTKGFKFGMIDKNFLNEYKDDLFKREIYIFGPPGMVNAMKKLCTELGVEESKIKAESFLGY
ncbi:MAG: FAD-dependent oxidoreductase [Candidatus Omnitrophica bacterium]|nr:FAD-dependent oxidoreductase [Candidatus Omnitrophota bacterium]